MSQGLKRHELPAIPQNTLVWEALTWRTNPMTGGSYHWYAGPIEPGMVFAWWPDVAHARKLIIVADGDAAPSFDAADSADGVIPRIDIVPTPADEDEFRRAVVPTTYLRCGVGAA